MPERVPSARRVALAAALVAAASGALPAALIAPSSREHAGATGPVRGAEVLPMRTDAEVVREWSARGLRGRTVVHAGRFLHYVDDEVVSITSTVLATPGTGRSLDQRLLQRASPRNYLAVASALGIVRRIFYVSPPRALAERLASLGMARTALPLSIDAGATPRVLDGVAASLGEPVLLDVDASWFDESDGKALLDALAARGLEVELATLTLGEDANDVTPGARRDMEAFVPVLTERLRGGRP